MLSSVFITLIAWGQPLNSIERGKAVRELLSSRKALLDAVAGLTPAQFEFKPAPERWSVAECLEHIALAEDAYYNLIRNKLLSSPPQPGMRTEVQGKDDYVLRQMQDRTSRREASSNIVPARKLGSPQEALQHWLASQDRMIQYVTTTQDELHVTTTQDELRNHFLPHRAVGLIDGYQWILLASGHVRRHTGQILEVKSSPGFPPK